MKIKNICCIGAGYVGLVSGVCFAQMGNSVSCVDIDEKKIQDLKKGIIPIYEPGLEEMTLQNYKKGTLDFTTDATSAIASSLISFIAVGTPEKKDGSCDLSYVFNVAKSIAVSMDDYKVIVNKSFKGDFISSKIDFCSCGDSCSSASSDKIISFLQLSTANCF